MMLHRRGYTHGRCFYFNAPIWRWFKSSNRFHILDLIVVCFRSKHIPEMIIGTIALLTSLLIANAYSGGLASIMTVPRYVQTISVMNLNLNWIENVLRHCNMTNFCKNADMKRRSIPPISWLRKTWSGEQLMMLGYFPFWMQHK